MIYSRLALSTSMIVALIGDSIGDMKENNFELMRVRSSGLRNLQSDDFFGNNDETEETTNKKTALSLEGESNNIFKENYDEFFGGEINETNDEGARLVVKVKVTTDSEPEKTRKPRPEKTRTPKPPRPSPTASPTLETRHSPTASPTLQTRHSQTASPTLETRHSPTASPTLETEIIPPPINRMCKVPERPKSRRSSRCSDARNKAYEEAISLYQSDFDGCDCYNVGQFSKAASKQLLEEKYKQDPKGNSQREGVKKCARDGVERYITDAAEACIGPDTCRDVGFLVTDLIITYFCELPVTTRFNPQQLKECAKEARKVCEGDLFGALIDFLKGGYECPAKDVFDSAEEAQKYINEELRKQCGDKV